MTRQKQKFEVVEVLETSIEGGRSVERTTRTKKPVTKSITRHHTRMHFLVQQGSTTFTFDETSQMERATEGLTTETKKLAKMAYHSTHGIDGSYSVEQVEGAYRKVACMWKDTVEIASLFKGAEQTKETKATPKDCCDECVGLGRMFDPTCGKCCEEPAKVQVQAPINEVEAAFRKSHMQPLMVPPIAPSDPPGPTSWTPAHRSSRRTGATSTCRPSRVSSRSSPLRSATRSGP